MSMAPETQKMCRIDDPITHIGYKIIYRTSMDRYEIWTQYRDKNGELHRNRVTYSEAIKRERDLESLTEYVRDYLVGEHVRFYEGKDFEVVDAQPVRNNVKQPQKRKARSAAPKFEEVKKEREAVYFDESGILHKALPGTKSMQLETLFREWENVQKNEPDYVWKMTNGGNENITKEHFRRDGIIDENTFEKEAVKVLFISAEANDNGYSAVTNSTSNSVEDYREYHFSGKETWKGRMRERLSELYKVISGTDRNSMSNPEAAMHFAVMDINKRGGGAQIGSGSHIEAYCRYYQTFIRREIEIISPDIVAIIGMNIYDMRLHAKYLGAIEENGRAYFDINKKMVPILRLWQTSYRYADNEPLPGYEDDLLVGRHAAKCLEEMERYGIFREIASIALEESGQAENNDKVEAVVNREDAEAQYADQVRMKELELQEKRMQARLELIREERENYEAYRKKWRIGLICLLVCIGISFVSIGVFPEKAAMVTVGVFMALVIFGGIALFILRPKAPKNRDEFT